MDLKLAVSGRIGPVRGGTSKRGYIGALFVIIGCCLVVTWPWFAATALAVKAGAGRHSDLRLWAGVLAEVAYAIVIAGGIVIAAGKGDAPRSSTPTGPPDTSCPPEWPPRSIGRHQPSPPEIASHARRKTSSSPTCSGWTGLRCTNPETRPDRRNARKGERHGANRCCCGGGVVKVRTCSPSRAP